MSSSKTAHLLLNPLLQQARFVKRLPFRYISALVLIALLATAGQILIQTLLSQQADSGHVISLAANQETLSQRVSKDALALAVFTDAKDRAFYFTEFTEVGASWNEVHLGLQHGDAKLNLPANTDAVIAQDFKNLQPQYDAILKAYEDVEQFAQAYAQAHPDAPYGFDATPLVPDVQAVMNAEEPFAHGMEGIVARFEQLDANHVWTVRVAEISLFLATLLALLLEGSFIFTPALHTLKDNLRSLEKADKRWRDYTTTLAQRSHQLEEAYEEAWQARSKTLLPVQQVGTDHYLVSGPARDRTYHVRRGDSGVGLVCECNAAELGYVCGHILSASHFQAARQRQAQEARDASAPQEPARSLHQMAAGASTMNRGQAGVPAGARTQAWSRNQTGTQSGARMQEWRRGQTERQQTDQR
jgi:hypothetical protein